MTHWVLKKKVTMAPCHQIGALYMGAWFFVLFFLNYGDNSVELGLRSTICTQASKSFMGTPGEVRTRWGY